MQDLAGKTLGILLTRGPGHADVGRALGLAHAAAERGARVEIFLMAEGADLLGAPDVLAFDRPGVRVTACTLSAMSRDAPALRGLRRPIPARGDRLAVRPVRLLLLRSP